MGVTDWNKWKSTRPKTPETETPTIILDISKFQECFKEKSDFIDFVKAVQEMVKQLASKLSDHPCAAIKTKVDQLDE